MSLETLKSTLGLGARANKFLVQLNYGDTDMDVLAKGTTLPDVTLGTVEVWFKGRKMTIAGEAQYSGTWDVIFYNTDDLKFRQIFIDEIAKIDSYDSEVKSVTSNLDYMKDLHVSQLDSLNQPTQSFTLHNAYPTVVSSIDLSSETADTITEFTVTFAYSHWTAD
jgi:hypothetical protein